MKPISIKQLQAADWKSVYFYQGHALQFRVFASDDFPGLTITHERALLVAAHKVKIVYSFNSRRTDSPIQIVRIYNEEARKDLSGRPTAGSAEPTERAGTGAVGL